MAAGAGGLLNGMLGRRRDTVVLAPRTAGFGQHEGARILPVLRFAGLTGGPFKACSFLQQIELMLAPLVWCLGHPSQRPDLVVCVQPFAAGVGGWLTWRLFGIPYLVLVHGEELTLLLRDRTPGRLRLRLQRLALRRAAAIVCNAANTRRAATQLYGLPETRLTVVHPAIDSTEGEVESTSASPGARERLVGEGWRLILMVGRLTERHKGFDTGIAAMAAIGQAIPDAKLVIAGPGDQSALRALAETAGVTDRVVFAGLLDRADLLALFRACDVFLLPGREVETIAEGFGIVYLEAARFAKPAIAGRAGGAPEAVLDGETGLLVDGESVADVAGAVIRLLGDRAYAELLGRQGKERVLRDFDGRRQHQQFAALVEELLHARPERQP